MLRQCEGFFDAESPNVPFGNCERRVAQRSLEFPLRLCYCPFTPLLWRNWEITMRTLRTCLVVVPFLWASLTIAQNQSRDEVRLSLTKAVMDDMAGGQLEAVYDRFSPDLQESVNEDKLHFAWNRLIAVSGAFQMQISQSTRTVHDQAIYVSKSQFENSKVELRLVFDDSNQITRISIMPVSDLSPENMEAAAKLAVDMLRQKQFDELTLKFDEDFKPEMPPERLEMSWSHVMAHLGQFKSVKIVVKDPEFDMVDVTCAFENGDMIVRIAFDPAGKVGGLWMMPAGPPSVETPKI